MSAHSNVKPPTRARDGRRFRTWSFRRTKLAADMPGGLVRTSRRDPSRRVPGRNGAPGRRIERACGGSGPWVRFWVRPEDRCFRAFRSSSDHLGKTCPRRVFADRFAECTSNLEPSDRDCFSLRPTASHPTNLRVMGVGRPEGQPSRDTPTNWLTLHHSKGRRVLCVLFPPISGQPQTDSGHVRSRDRENHRPRVEKTHRTSETAGPSGVVGNVVISVRTWAISRSVMPPSKAWPLERRRAEAVEAGGRRRVKQRVFMRPAEEKRVGRVKSWGTMGPKGVGRTATCSWFVMEPIGSNPRFLCTYIMIVE